MRGIVGYGAYVPYHRLKKSAISEVLGAGGGRGTRSVASYDEDATSMAVEAARNLLKTPGQPTPNSVYFATATPPYLDKTNANTVHAALNLPSSTFAGDMIGSVRSFGAALRAGLESTKPTLVVGADVRSGRPSSSDEANLGDAGVALMIGDDADSPVLAEYLGGASATSEFLDRWRLPEWNYSRVWEERFGEYAYLPLVAEAGAAAFKECRLEPADVDSVIVAGLQARAVRGAAKAAGVDGARVVDDLSTVIGNTGTPHASLLLAATLDVAAPNQTIMVIQLADGCDVSFFRTTDALAAHTNPRTVAIQIAEGNDGLSYGSFATWRGFIHREPPRRPDLVPPAAPPSLRTNQWKYAFVGSRDRASGAVHLPPQRVSVKGGAVDDMEMVSMADVQATVATFTIDRLAFSLAPPAIAVVIDFDGGGRFNCQLTDADPDSVKIGNRVQMTFRRLYTADGVHNYFWKAKPVLS